MFLSIDVWLQSYLILLMSDYNPYLYMFLFSPIVDILSIFLDV